MSSDFFQLRAPAVERAEEGIGLWPRHDFRILLGLIDRFEHMVVPAAALAVERFVQPVADGFEPGLLALRRQRIGGRRAEEIGAQTAQVESAVGLLA